jgi:hypothetical protein
MPTANGLARRPAWRCVGAIAALVSVATIIAVPAAQAQAGSLSRSEATRLAKEILEPGREPGVGAAIRVFASHSPLPRGTLISQPGPGERKIRLRTAAWLFWEDIGYGLAFPHPSKLLLLDARSGRTVATRNLTIYPLLNGHPFPRPRDYGNPGPRRTEARGKPWATAARADLSNDAIVSIGQREDLAFRHDFKMLNELAHDLKIEKVDAKPSVQGLREAIEKLVLLRRKDILLFIAGHGYPEHDVYSVDKDGKRQLDAAGSAKPKLNLDVKDNGAAQLTAGELAGILRDFPQIQFKVIVDSCYAGRFIDDLKALNAAGGPKNVAVAMTSANAKEPTTVGFLGAIATGLRKWAADADPSAKLEDGLREAFKGDAVKSWAIHATNNGGSHPQITPRPPPPEPPPPPPPPPCTSTLVRSPGTGSFTAANHIRVQAKCSQPVRKIIVTSLSGDNFDACAQTAGSTTGCSGLNDTLTTLWNAAANEQLEAYGRVTANADGNYRVRIFAAGDALLSEYTATVPAQP